MAMPRKIVAAKLVNNHLEAGIEELEREARLDRYNTSCIQELGCAATVLGQRAIADRAAQLLRAAPGEAFWAGIISNIELQTRVPERMRTIDAVAELEERHPKCSTGEIVERVRSRAVGEEHLALCLEDRVQDARQIAGAGLQLEEMGATLAVLGEFDAARNIASDPALETFRQQGVRFVLAIELFRWGRVDEAGVLLTELESTGLGAWERAHLALGLAGREPWVGYPYPDW